MAIAQEVVDIAFDLVLTARDNLGWFAKQDHESLAAWVRKQFSECGIDLQEMGMSHGVIIKKPRLPEDAGILLVESPRPE